MFHVSLKKLIIYFNKTWLFNGMIVSFVIQNILDSKRSENAIGFFSYYILNLVFWCI